MPDEQDWTSGRSGPPIRLTPQERDAPTEWLPSSLDESLEALVIRIYLALVQHHAPSVSLLIAQGMDGQQVERALRVLSSRHLVVIAPDGTIEVPSPDTSLPAHAAELERQAREARASAYELAQMYFAARSGARPQSADVRTLTTLDEIHGASAEIVSAGRQRVRSFRAPSPRTEQIFAAPDHAQSQPSYGADGTELAMRSVFDNHVLQYPRAIEVLELRASAGERSRFVASLPFSAVIVDDVAAVVDVSNIEPSGNGSLLIRSRPVVRGLVDLAELFWELGTAVNPHLARSVDERDTAVLSLMAAGASDATIARRTGVSQRTVERRVAALMDRLGAGTRFQAGVQAARRGLI